MSFLPLSPPDGTPPRKGFWGVGLSAGLLGASVLALRWLIRPPTQSSIPETISPPRFSTRAFQSGCGQMIYHESGDGPEPTLVFIHGLEVGASSYEWAGVYSSFSETRRVLAPDVIGFGESERPKGKLKAADCAASLADFVEGLCHEEARRPIVVASGLGAGLAALMAARNPELLARLVLWMPTGRADTSWWLNGSARVPTLKQFIYRNQLARRGAIRRRLAARAGTRPDAIPPEAVEVYALCAQQYQADCSIYRLLRRQLDLDLPEAIRAGRTPVTFLWPERSSAQALNAARRLVAESRAGSLRIVPGVGAGAPLLAPQALTAILRAELPGDLRVWREAV